MAELFIQNALFPGKTEGLQIFEIIMVLGKPKNNYFEKFKHLPREIRDDFLALDDFKPMDLTKIINKSGKYEKDFVKVAADLIEKMIKMDPDERIDAGKALQHKFFN